MYRILLKVTKPAFALSSLPLAFCFVHAKKKTDITSIKSNLNKVVNLQNVQIVTDSTFSLCRAREKTLRKKREALLFLLYVFTCSLKMVLHFFRKSQCVGRGNLCFMRQTINSGSSDGMPTVES
jgi:hypothetical protein